MSKQYSMEDIFDMLHRKQAEKLLEMLDDPDVSPSVFSAINKFLADNGITGVRNDDNALGLLASGFEAYSKENNLQ